jgi:tetratricopeptide (TPR) repeat protein
LYHPDQSADPDAATKFMAITEAYQVLSDPLRRASYDRIIDGREGQVEPKRQSPPQTKQEPVHRAAPRRPSEPPPKPGDVIRLANLIGKGKIAEAETLAQSLVRKLPTQPLPYAVLGDIARSRGQYKEAARLYALAAQMDPMNDLYQKLHESMLELMSPRVAAAQSTKSAATVPRVPLIIGAVACLSAFVFAAFAGDPSVTTLAPIDTWKASTFLALIVAGLALGASLATSGLVERFDAIQRGTVVKLNPSLALATVCLFNFWLAAGLFIWVGLAQRTFHPGTSRMLASAALLTVLFSALCGLSGQPAATQVLLWGGNWIYLFALLGWLVADSLAVRH